MKNRIVVQTATHAKRTLERFDHLRGLNIAAAARRRYPHQQAGYGQRARGQGSAQTRDARHIFDHSELFFPLKVVAESHQVRRIASIAPWYCMRDDAIPRLQPPAIASEVCRHRFAVRVALRLPLNL
jgi:hypothetical protein